MSELEKISDLTREVETLVAEARWEEAAALEAERRALVTRYVERNPQRVEDLRPIHERGQRSLALASVRREGLVVEASAFLKNVRGLRAYQSNQAPAGSANSRR
ncbi:MAG: hypothetical protein PVH89_01000 [Gammaproteobacteria bacterium]